MGGLSLFDRDSRSFFLPYFLLFFEPPPQSNGEGSLVAAFSFSIEKISPSFSKFF